MARRDGHAENRRWFGADIIWRVDYAIEEWAQKQRSPGGSRSAPRDLDEILGHNRRWWPRRRSGERRGKNSLCLGELQEICDIIGVEPEEVVGDPSPLWALRGLAAEAWSSQQQKKKKKKKKGANREPRPRRNESLLKAALRLRRQGDIAGAAVLLVREIEREESADAWVHGSFLLGSAGRLQSSIAAAAEGYLLSTLTLDRRGQARSLLALANAYFAQAAYEKADSAYVAASQNEDELRAVDLWALYQGHGKTLQALGRLQEAGIAIQRAIEHADTPGRRFFLWWLLGDIQRDMDEVAAAMSTYQGALESVGKGTHPEVSSVDRAHLLTLVGATAYEAGREDVARNLMPAALTLLSELSRTAPEAQAVLAAAHGAAARGERAAAWVRAEEALASIRNRLGADAQGRA